MKAFILKVVQSIVPAFVLFSLISCSKDTDLLNDYMLSELNTAHLIGDFAINDNFVVLPQESIILDVLANDNFANPDKVKIVETSQPSNGFVVINEDKTLTYFPDSADAPTIPSEDIKVNQEILQGDDNEEQPKEEEIEEETATEITETPKIEEHEQAPVEANDQKQEKKETATETFDYSVESTDEKGNTTTQQASVNITTDLGSLKAFPNAEGYGKHITGGRGGYVIHVTNLNDKGPGSLREALYAKGKRTVVFDISGYIDLSGTVSIRNPDITIAGQTAPGGGITIRGANISVKASNVIIQYLRVRPGYNAATGSDCINVIADQNNLNIDGVIIDHCSLSWSIDENMNFTSNDIYSNNSIKNVTVQNCINSEPLKNYGVLIGKRVTRISYIKTLFAHVPNRIPESTYGYTEESYEFVNNIIYNYNRPTKICYGVYADVIGNVYKSKETPAVPNIQYSINRTENPNGKASDGKVFSSDNLQIGINPHGMFSKIWTDNRQSSRVLTDSPYLPIPASDLEESVLSNVGANIFDDPVDIRILEEYHKSNGLRGPSHESEVGGYPSLDVERHSNNYDSDRDGMSDKWELENGLNPNDPNDGNANQNDAGYTNLDFFLHYLTLENKVKDQA